MATLKPDPAHDVVGNGTESHYDLARQLEMRGYTVDGDPEDNEHSWVRFSDEIVGEIHGDSEATVTTVSDRVTSEHFDKSRVIGKNYSDVSANTSIDWETCYPLVDDGRVVDIVDGNYPGDWKIIDDLYAVPGADSVPVEEIGGGFYEAEDGTGTVTTSFGTLYDYQTGDPIRPATQAEHDASDAEVASGRYEGVIAVDWRSEGGWNGEDFRRCYVER